jgi:hypothetical protein
MEQSCERRATAATMKQKLLATIDGKDYAISIRKLLAKINDKEYTVFIQRKRSDEVSFGIVCLLNCYCGLGLTAHHSFY